MISKRWEIIKAFSFAIKLSQHIKQHINQLLEIGIIKIGKNTKKYSFHLLNRSESNRRNWIKYFLSVNYSPLFLRLNYQPLVPILEEWSLNKQSKQSQTNICQSSSSLPSISINLFKKCLRRLKQSKSNIFQKANSLETLRSL